MTAHADGMSLLGMVAVSWLAATLLVGVLVSALFHGSTTGERRHSRR